jgi:hypothetical protein
MWKRICRPLTICNDISFSNNGQPVTRIPEAAGCRPIASTDDAVPVATFASSPRWVNGRGAFPRRELNALARRRRGHIRSSDIGLPEMVRTIAERVVRPGESKTSSLEQSLVGILT